MDNQTEPRQPSRESAGEDHQLRALLDVISLHPQTGDDAEPGAGHERSREYDVAHQLAELYRRVVETSPDAILVTDLNGTVLMCNQQAALQQGLGGPDALVGLNAFDFVAPEDRERAAENARRTLESGSVRAVEYTILRHDGTRIPAELSASLIRDNQGAPRAFIGVVRNISERKRAAEALRSSEEKLLIGIAQMPCTIWTTDTDLRVTSLSGIALARLGVDHSEQQGRTVYEILEGTEIGSAPIAAHELALTGEEAEYQQAVEDRYFEVRIRPFRNERGEIIGCVGVAMDVTERKQAEDALSESEERYRVLYNDNPSMYFTVSADGSVLSVNQFGAQQLGYTPEELVGKPVLGVFYQDDMEEVAGQLAACVAAPGELCHWEFRKVRKDGEVIWVKEAARATQDSSGETIVLIVCEDITERKRMEEELQRVREELEGKVDRKVRTESAYGLTFRELTVLHLVAQGSSDKDIAETLSISRLTASKHVANILTKMGAPSRIEASTRAVRELLLE
jgi:PAS domain S-box-containing protein